MFSNRLLCLGLIRAGLSTSPVALLALLLMLVLSGLIGLSEASPVKLPPNTPKNTKTAPQPYPYQLAMGDCAPWDGPAVRIYLAQKPLVLNKDGYFQPNAPFINLGIWTHHPELNKWLSFEAYQDKLGSVSFCSRHNTCGPAEGEIFFSEFSAQHIAGTLKLKAISNLQPIPNFKPQVIPFKAKYFLPKRPVLCG